MLLLYGSISDGFYVSGQDRVFVLASTKLSGVLRCAHTGKTCVGIVTLSVVKARIIRVTMVIPLIATNRYTIN